MNMFSVSNGNLKMSSLNQYVILKSLDIIPILTDLTLMTFFAQPNNWI